MIVVVPDLPNFLRLLSADVSVMETNVSQSGHFNVQSSQHALQGSSYFGNYEMSRRCRFSRIVENTHSKSPFRLIEVKQSVSKGYQRYFSARSKYSQRIRTCKYNDAI